MKIPALSISLVLLSFSVSSSYADIARITVLDANDKPVPAAQLDINIYKPGQPSVQRETDAAGKCEVDTEYSRSAALIAQAVIVVPGYAIGGGQLKRGENVFRLEKTRPVSGLVTLADGTPVANARVVLFRIAWDAKAEKDDLHIRNSRFKNDYTAKTDETGRWQLDAVPAASTSANFALDDPAYAYATASADGPTAKTLIAVKAATITGRVIDEAGKPLSGINVSVAGLLSTGGGHEKAVTGEDGAYLMESLPRGIFSLVPAPDTKRGLIGAPQDEVHAREGERTTVPDLVLTPGALVQGTVIDADTGAPVKGAGVAALDAPNRRLNFTPTLAMTDENGAFSVRVLPGKSSIEIGSAPVSHLKGTASPESIQVVEVAKGETAKVTLKLKPSFFLAGTAKGEDGTPLANIEVFAGNHGEYKNTRTDENGAWRIEGLPAGPLGFWAQPDWEVIEWPAVSVPFAAPVGLKLRKNDLQSLRGRIVDTKGQPVPGAKVWLTITFKSGNTTRETSDGKTYITDAKGSYKVTGLKSGFGIKLKVEAPGYRYLSGGRAFQPDTEIFTVDGKLIPNPNAVYVATDAVLEALMTTVKGKVVDGAGKPVPGVRVFSPEGEGASVLSAADGSFVLAGLPDRPVEFMAAQDRSFAKGQGSAIAAPALVLQSGPKLEDDGGLGMQILESVAATENGPQALQSAGFLNDLLMQNPEEAFRLSAKIGGAEGALEYRELGLISELGKHDAQLARLKADAVVARLKQTPQEWMVLRTFGVLASIKHPSAGEFYEPARKFALEDTRNSLGVRAMQQMSLAVSASQFGINAAEVKQLADLSFAMLEDPKVAAESVGWVWADLAQRAARVSAAMAESVLEKTPLNQRLNAAGLAIPLIAAYDMPSALRLLDAVGKNEDSSTAPSIRLAAIEEIKAKLVPLIGVNDAAAALAMARQITGANGSFSRRPLALVEAARRQPAEQVMPLLREAYDGIANSSGPGRLTVKARIAAAIYERDAKIGLALFDEIVSQIVETNRNESAAIAFYLTPFDSARGRQLIETQWAKAEEAGGRADIDRQDAARAMAGIDPARATEMLQVLQKTSPNSTTMRTQIEIARTLLTPVPQRKALPFRQTSQNVF